MRDNFPAKIVEALAKRASFICSNPDCRCLTLGASDIDQQLFIYNGVASHICAASEGGPRFDKEMTPEYRSSISNGIFLCSNCSVAIDKNNGIDFAVEDLMEWKEQHEAWIRKNLNKSIDNIGSKINHTTINVNNTSGGISAGIVNINSKPSVRNLEYQDKVELINNLKDRTENITLTCPLGNSEAFNYASEFVKFLKENGYTNVKGVHQGIFQKPINGEYFERKENGVYITIGSQIID